MTGRPGDRGWPALWPDPPWRMRGRNVTARFPVSCDVLRRSVHPSLLPERRDQSLARLRFWELEFESLRPSEGELACPATGAFREAIVAFPAEFRGEATETTTFLWTDSDTYLTWGREYFGWPTQLGRIVLEGELWSERPLQDGTSGRAEARTPDGTLALEDVVIGQRLEAVAAGSSATFATMRRLLHAGHPPGGVEAVLTELQVVEPGRRFEASGRIALHLRAGHPLHEVATHAISIEAIDAIECVVGDGVRTAGA